MRATSTLPPPRPLSPPCPSSSSWRSHCRPSSSSFRRCRRRRPTYGRCPPFPPLPLKQLLALSPSPHRSPSLPPAPQAALGALTVTVPPQAARGAVAVAAPPPDVAAPFSPLKQPLSPYPPPPSEPAMPSLMLPVFHPHAQCEGLGLSDPVDDTSGLNRNGDEEPAHATRFSKRTRHALALDSE